LLLWSAIGAETDTDVEEQEPSLLQAELRD
jgi:hypothetical protein